MECESCGSHSVSRRRIEGFLVEECGLCGHLQGNDDAVSTIEDLREGRERGFDDRIVPLVSALERAEVFHIEQATAGSSTTRSFPQVLFRLPGNDASYIERLLQSVELANRETKLRWLIELTLQHQLIYILRPRFWKQPSEITQHEVALAQQDIPLLAKRIKRDLNLTWWTRPE